MPRSRGQVIPRGDKRWLVRVFLGRDAQGKRHYSNHTFEGSLKEAREELTKRLRESDTKLIVRPSKLTFSEYLKAWYNGKLNITARTLNDYKYAMKRYVEPVLGGLKLREITPLAVQDVVSKLVAQGLGARSIEYAHAILHQALEKAVRLGFLARNPASDTELPQKVRRPFTILSLDQMETLFESEKHQPLYPLWLLLLHSGLRPGEALALKWADLDGDTIRLQRVLTRKSDGSYHVVEQRAKTEDSLRAVTLTKSVVEVLKEHRARQAGEMLKAGPTYTRHDFIFAGRRGEFLDPTNVRNRWKSALKRAKLPTNIRLYDTRHSHATALLNSNVNLAWVAARLGHASVQTTEAAYTRVLPEAHHEMADVMEELHTKAREKNGKTK
jgi:integrase